MNEMGGSSLSMLLYLLQRVQILNQHDLQQSSTHLKKKHQNHQTNQQTLLNTTAHLPRHVAALTLAQHPGRDTSQHIAWKCLELWIMLFGFVSWQRASGTFAHQWISVNATARGLAPQRHLRSTPLLPLWTHHQLLPAERTDFFGEDKQQASKNDWTYERAYNWSILYNGPLELETFLCLKPVFLSAARAARRAGCREWMLNTRIVVAHENAKVVKSKLILLL